MDKLTEYPQLIERILAEYIDLCNRRPNQNIETFLIVDQPKGHYIWMNLGWQNGERITGIYSSFDSATPRTISTGNDNASAICSTLKLMANSLGIASRCACSACSAR